MIDPLTEVVTLLRPSAPFAKMATAAGKWIARRAETGLPFFCAIIAGAARLTVEGQEPLVLDQGDFVLVPAAFDFTVSSLDPPADGEETAYVFRPDGEIRHGDPNASPDLRMLIGYCVFASPDAGLLVSLLPQVVQVRGEPALTTLVSLIYAEFRARRPGRDVVLARLLDVLLIEALRSAPGSAASPGLVRGLADDRLAVAMRRMHEQPSASWTVAELAREAAMSRSAFFARFSRLVGVTPMEYLLGWRIALAKSLLREGVTVGDVAARVGYSSASAFSVAFTRNVGRPPAHFARRDRETRTTVPPAGGVDYGRTEEGRAIAVSAHVAQPES
ncbi:AraC family transcriptional regulator [Acidovorax radicis]|uniref:AraC family transcriptional regulator n=1 Tax=Acidovorax radicis TaxID=758826 RepID=UPI001CF7F8D7|nr:AraC family transcriptional regulator [Acidovorax radicis]UCU99394.1 AraC family transcriptional regulator [Acidovorax radicis]